MKWRAQADQRSVGVFPAREHLPSSSRVGADWLCVCGILKHELLWDYAYSFIYWELELCGKQFAHLVLLFGDIFI